MSPNSTEDFRFDRCKALAGGIFAIAGTLLVAGIAVRTDHRFSEQGLLAFLERIGFDLFVYGVSFRLASTYWVQHAAIRRCFWCGSRALIWLNLLCLFFVTLLPFVPRLKSVYREEAMVILPFGHLQLLIGLALIALWIYAASHPYLPICPVEQSVRRSVTRRMFVNPIVISVVAVPLSFLSVHLGSR